MIVVTAGAVRDHELVVKGAHEWVRPGEPLVHVRGAMKRDVDAVFNALMDELRQAVDEDGLHSERATALRCEIEDLLRQEMRDAQAAAVDRREGMDALN